MFDLAVFEQGRDAYYYKRNNMFLSVIKHNRFAIKLAAIVIIIWQVGKSTLDWSPLYVRIDKSSHVVLYLY